MENILTPRKPSKPVFFRASDLTASQIEELQKVTGLGLGEVLTMAVDRLYQAEVAAKAETK